MPGFTLLPSHEQFLIPDGAQGTRVTLRAMARLVRQGKADPSMRLATQNILKDIPGKAWMTEIRTLFNWVQANVRYMLDTNDQEVIQTPQYTYQVGSGDCDDQCILLATLLECAGHPARFVALGFPEDAGEFSHVILQTRIAGDAGWISLDPTEQQPMGWQPSDASGAMVQDI